MSHKSAAITTLAIFITFGAWAQDQPGPRPPVPIYQVTVIERTVSAINYQYRNGPTRLDFRGTVLMPDARGDATVESKAGRVQVDAKFDRVQAATRFGPEYLTYVLWAITPEGHAKNLGEVLPGSSDHAHLVVTADFQTFGMIVTAEPYAAVRQPSNVVVLENQPRPDTIGQVQQIQAKYELLPRGHYTYQVPANMTAAAAGGEKLPMDRYEALLEVYQAQNAVQIARSQGADKYAGDTFARAEAALKQAQDFYARKVDRSTVVTAARQAAQTAEDARTIALQKKRDEELAQAKSQADREQQLRLQAEAEAQRLRQQAAADRSQIDRERSEREQAQAEAAAAPFRNQAPPAPPPVATDGSKTQLRVSLLRELSSVMQARDTPRGLVVEAPDGDFSGVSLTSDTAARLSRIASILASHPGLYVAIEGHADNAGGSRIADERAMAVRDALVRAGAPAGSMSARGFGDSRPMASNATAAGRIQNRRVEITISGDAIGSTPYWDRAYSIAPRQ
jgi:outer membrane protein OmpA-like peptidoglycan-associated protein